MTKFVICILACKKWNTWSHMHIPLKLCQEATKMIEYYWSWVMGDTGSLYHSLYLCVFEFFYHKMFKEGEGVHYKETRNTHMSKPIIIYYMDYRKAMDQQCQLLAWKITCSTSTLCNILNYLYLALQWISTYSMDQAQFLPLLYL